MHHILASDYVYLQFEIPAVVIAEHIHQTDFARRQDQT